MNRTAWVVLPALVIATTSCAALPGATSNVSEFAGPVENVDAIARIDENRLPGGDGKTVRLHQGYANPGDKGVRDGKYWSFESEMAESPAMFTLNSVAPLWMFMDKDGKRVGQNAVATIPGLPGYTPYWQVISATVPDGYVPQLDPPPSSIRPVADVQKALKEPGFKETRMDVAVNCPIVAQDTNLEGAESTRAHLCWYEGNCSYYFAFDTLKVKDGKVPIVPIRVFMPKDADPMTSGWMCRTATGSAA